MADIITQYLIIFGTFSVLYLFVAVSCRHWPEIKKILSRKSRKANELDTLQSAISFVLDQEGPRGERIERQRSEMQEKAQRLGRPSSQSHESELLTNRLMHVLDSANILGVDATQLVRLAQIECTRRQRAIEAEEREKAARLEDIKGFDNIAGPDVVGTSPIEAAKKSRSFTASASTQKGPCTIAEKPDLNDDFEIERWSHDN